MAWWGAAWWCVVVGWLVWMRCDSCCDGLVLGGVLWWWAGGGEAWWGWLSATSCGGGDAGGYGKGAVASSSSSGGCGMVGVGWVWRGAACCGASHRPIAHREASRPRHSVHRGQRAAAASGGGSRCACDAGTHPALPYPLPPLAPCRSCTSQARCRCCGAACRMPTRGEGQTRACPRAVA